MESTARKIESSAPTKTEGKKVSLFPLGIPYIVGNEGAERFSFYGMRAILYVYMTALYLKFDEKIADPALVAEAKARATQINHLFIAGVYAFPMIGAILADRLLGKYNVIFWVSMIYCAGHGVLAFAGRMGEMGQFGAAEMGMYLGLTLIAIGSGGIKPCVSANVGDQFTKENADLVTKVYQIFYFIINFGSFFSTIITPYLYDKFGPEVAFGVPGVLMGVATVVFWMGRNKFTKIPPRETGTIGLLDVVVSTLLFVPFGALIFAFFAGGHEGSNSWSSYVPHLGISVLAIVAAFLLFSARQKKKEDAGFLSVTLFAFRSQHLRRPGMGFFEVAKEKFGNEAAEGPPAVLRVMLVFSMVSIFWALFDQHSSTWIEQASQMNLHLRVPALSAQFILYATVGLAVLGLVWLMLWVANKPVSKKWVTGILVVTGVAGVAAVIGDMTIGGWQDVHLKASQLSSLNPLMVMMIIPGLNVFVYAPLRKRGIEVTPLQKMTVGMFLAAAAFATAAFLQLRIETLAPQGEKMHSLWQVIQYTLMTTSEVLVSITGLEFAYTQAPRVMKSTVMGFWLLCVTAGNVLVAFLAPLQKTASLSHFFWIFAGLMAFASVIFAVLAYFYKGKTYLQEAA